MENSRVVELQLGALPPGGYTAMARVEGGAEARLNFACELGGTAFADSRPDPDLIGLQVLIDIDAIFEFIFHPELFQVEIIL